MTDEEKTTGGSDIKDRKTGLVVFGVIQIFIGLLCVLMVSFITYGMLASSAHNDVSTTSASVGMPALWVYILLAIWFVWMGIGSIEARRWARALLLVSSWIWLIGGILGVVSTLILFPKIINPEIYNQMGMSEQTPSHVVAVIKYVTIGFMMFIFVIVPGAFVLFYKSKYVKATCEKRDLNIRWTDKCPLPVLAVILISVFAAVGTLQTGFYGWTIPFFGFILSGLAGAGVVLVGSLLLGYVAWGMYRLSVKAWWCAVLLIIAWVGSASITFSRVSMIEFFERMKIPASQLELTKHFASATASWWVPYSLLWAVIALAYLLYIKRYFIRPHQPPSV